MAGQTVSGIANILKNLYLDPIRKQFQDSVVLLNKLKSGSENISGYQAVMALHTSGNSGIGARADGGTLPTAGAQGFAQAVYNCAYNYGRIKLTGPAIAASRNNKGAFIKALDAEIQGMVKDLKGDFSRQLHGNGTGVLGLVNGDPGTGTTLTMDNPGTMYIQKNMSIQLVDPSSTTAGDFRANVGSKTITSKTSSTACETAAFHADAADNDFVVRSGSFRLESMGLGGIISDANPGTSFYVGAINRSTAGNEYWKAQVKSNSGNSRDLTLNLMQQAWDAAEEEGGEIKLMLCNRIQRRAYAALVATDVRYASPMSNALDGGFDVVHFNGQPMVVDTKCLPNTIWFIDTDKIELAKMSDFDWMDSDGAVLSRISGEDAYEAVLYIYATLAASQCNCHAKLTDLSTSW